MWGICKPKIEDAKGDIVIFKEKGIVKGKDVDSLDLLVEQYEAQGGKVTNTQHDIISEKGAKSIHAHYEDTEANKPLYYIRQELNENVMKCPYCAIGQPATLDHYMPKNKYKALALCRLNLVPMCWECNRGKGHTHPYTEYIHPYYLPDLSGITFLNAHIEIVGDVLNFTFSFDKEALGNEDLYEQFISHWRNMKLNERLRKSVIDFIHSEVLSESTDMEVLVKYVAILAERIKNKYGLNDWRSAIMRALSQQLNGENGNVIVKNLISMKRQVKDIKI